MKTVKRIDFEAGILTGKSLKTYTIESRMSAERYAMWQILERELALGLSIESLFKKLQEGYSLVNSMKFADAAVLLMDLMRGVAKLEERQPTFIKMAMLMINETNENRDIINQDMLDFKIKDLNHYDYADFFIVATQSVGGLIKVYKEFTEMLQQIPTIDA